MSHRHGRAAPNNLERAYGNPGTLYARCGGVFGVSAFVARCMDMWMADPLLNANQEVATWHVKAQRCGFKFLVVQVICNLTGGPQKYTGRDLALAHKHLNISEAEWEKFMDIFNEVCAEFGLPAGDVDDLNALMISMEMDCVVYPGERAPPNPGPARPGGSSLYARLGGVYPLALFVDRLVDALLSDPRVHIPHDGQKRNECSLKYLVTEFMCSIAGGPEVITARNLDETKLLIPKAQWRLLVVTASLAADHLPAQARPGLLQVLQASKDLFVDPNSPDVSENGPDPTPAMVKDLKAAASGRMLSREVIAARHAAPGAHVAARKRVFGDPRTLYGRGGGVYGLARLIDQLMDTWMANPALNANAMVARWHQSAQKYGFKSLVTQIMGYLTGGRQKYTGRPMDEAHKHLSITIAQWRSFMTDAEQVFRVFKVNATTQRDLGSILEAYHSQCVVFPGEVAPADPGPAKPNASAMGTLFFRLGGVYPIAHFVDRLVEAVLKGDRVKVQWDPVEDLQAKRHPPGLKYMITELLCNGTGGPETVTSKGFDDAKLGVEADEWPLFLALAQEAATLWPNQHLRNAVLSVLGDLKAEICIGIIAEGVKGLDAETPDAAKRRKLQAAGFDYVLASAALDKSDGDLERAAALLVSGWVPEDALVMPAAPSGGCPFTGAVGGGGGCPFASQPAVSASLAAQGETKAMATAPAIDDRLMDAVRLLSEKGVGAAEIAKLLNFDETAVRAALPTVVRILGSSMQEKLDELMHEDSELCCPVSLMVFTDPVIASDGFTYERTSLEGLIRLRMTSPMTRENLEPQFFPTRQKKAEAMQFRETQSALLLKFADEASRENPQMCATALERVTEYLEVLKPASQSTMASQAARLWRKIARQPPPLLQGWSADVD